MTQAGPPRWCELCPRLVELRKKNQQLFPGWYNGAVPSFGPDDAELLIVGLAPGLKGANRTGRPFTGDFAGHLLYSTLKKFGYAKGEYDERPDDGFQLVNARIANAVRCLPPENKPLPQEVKTCRQYLVPELHLPSVKKIITLGKVAHDSLCDVMGLRKKDYPFGHNARYDIKAFGRSYKLVASYHCSKYNTSTRRLTEDMFHQIFE